MINGLIMSLGVVFILWAAVWHFCLDRLAPEPTELAAYGIILLVVGML